jgi:anti-anti-sigma regulatory factor
MLKITVTETPTERKWVLAGRLVGPWVEEFRATWKRAVIAHASQACTIDLNEVTFVDKDGERLLRALFRKGVQLVSEGLYTKHILERLRTPRITKEET